jgi:hypothetical protein
MNAPNDLPREMRGSRLDDDTLERLLAGAVEPDDAPPGYAEVARVLRTARTTGVALELDEVSREAEHVAAARTLLGPRSPASTPSHGRSRKMRSKGYRLKVSGLVVVGTLAATSGLAAAGALPDAAQDALSGVLDRVGITVPAGGDHPASSGEQISVVATTTEAVGAEKGAEISSLASGGMSQAGQHGSPGAQGSGAAPVATPNGGGTGTADAASGGASGAGTGTADEQSDGRSEAGSGNAPEPPEPPDPPAP